MDISISIAPNPFDSLKLRNYILKNRFIAAPMATRYASKDGFVTETMIAYYKDLALTGVSMLIVEAAAISPEGVGWARELAVYTPKALEGLQQLAETIRERGAIPILQLHHAGRQAILTKDYKEAVAPSAIPCPVLNTPVRALTKQEIKDLIDKFTYSAELAQKAGFAGIELHGAHGYLLHQFISPLSNQRDDEYALQPHSVNRFPLEVVQSIRSAFPNLIISYRLSARDYLPKGLNLKTSCMFAKALEGAGVDLISVSGGMYPSLHGPESILGPSTPYGVFRDDARDIKESVTIPVAVAGKIQFPSLAKEIISNRDADLIALGRMLLRDPEWIQKAQGTNKEPILKCLLCIRCQFHSQGCPDGARKPVWKLIQ